MSDNHEYHSIDGRKLLMVANRISNGAIEIVLFNYSYKTSRDKYLRLLLYILMIYIANVSLLSSHLAVHSIFWFLFAIDLYLLLNLVNYGKFF